MRVVTPKRWFKMCEGIRAPKMAEQFIQVKDFDLR